MSALTSLVRSTIGKKVVMGLTGLIMVGWLVLHTTGNLLIFAGQDAFNHYAHFIQSGFGVEPQLLWLMRIALVIAVGAHIWAAVGLTARNRSARPVAYAGGRKDAATTYAARFMMGAGVVLLLYVAFHLAHLTVGAFSDHPVMPTTFSKVDAYANLVHGVGVPFVGALYILANLALGAHLYHGVGSGLQTLGADGPTWTPLKARLTLWVPLFIAGGNLVIALTCMFGVGVLIDAPDPAWVSPH
ncbi:MAG: succinate dehydrogenase cytochrome b subunit [Alphaproteobacteria bacterium]|nr:succinate dehydrogenase cytochrome b subunit [Alphaproteobacteria bacterium]